MPALAWLLILIGPLLITAGILGYIGVIDFGASNVIPITLIVVGAVMDALGAVLIVVNRRRC